MAINFPSNPNDNDTYTDPNSGNEYIYDSTYSVWKLVLPSSEGGGSPLAFDTANVAFDTANIAFTRANTANTVAATVFDVSNSAFTKANSASSEAAVAFGRANTANTLAATVFDVSNSAFAAANTADTKASAAFDAVNTAGTNASNAFNRANTANTLAATVFTVANAAFAAANSAGGGGDPEVYDKGNSGTGTVTFNRADSSAQKVTATGNFTAAFSGWPASGVYADFIIEIVNGGAYTITWPTMAWVKPAGDTQSTPIRPMQSSGSDWLYVWTVNGGANLWARFL